MFILSSFSASKYNTDNSPNCDANKNQSLPLEGLLHQSVKKGEKAEQINTPSRFHIEKKKKQKSCTDEWEGKPLHNTQSGKDSCFKTSGNRMNKENMW
jgi:hypothetical protein